MLPVDEDHIPFEAIWRPRPERQFKLEVGLACNCNCCKGETRYEKREHCDSLLLGSVQQKEGVDEHR